MLSSMPATAIGERPVPPVGARPDDRAAIATFVGVEIATIAWCLTLGRSEWFFLDEWDFLAERRLFSAYDLLRPHNEHWTTIPVVAYRVLYSLVGLRSYLPYRMMSVGAHAVVAALLFVVMRRAGVHRWITVAAASLFMLFGAGGDNILRPFQVTFTLAFALGLMQLLFADHDGAIDGRDWAALAAGLAALMTAGVAVTMVVVVGIAVALRRGWRAALLQTAPLGALYIAWFAGIGHNGYSNEHRAGLADTGRFVAQGVRATYGAFGPWGGVGILYAAVLVTGVLVAFVDERRAGRARRLAAPVALLGGSVVFLAIAANGRLVFGPEAARASRYLYLVGAMTLPALACAINAFARRWPVLLPVAIAVFLVGIPANLDAMRDSANRNRVPNSYRQMVLTLPRVPLARTVPRSIRPEPVGAPYVTIGWLVDGVRDGHIPPPRRQTAALVKTANFRLSFFQREPRDATERCSSALKFPVVVTLRAGDVIGLYEGARVFPGASDTLRISPAAPATLLGPLPVFRPRGGESLLVLRDLGNVRLDTPTPYFAPRVCLVRGGA
jgi:hypothetical protein